MNKITLLLFFLVFNISATVFSQDFLGLNTGNYAGVTGVSLQPASIVDSRHKFDINLFSTGINYNNNYFLVNRSVILKFNKNNFDDYDEFKSRYLSEASVAAGDRVFFNISNRIQLPLSFMATTGKRSAIALNMQLRSMIQGRGITPDLAKMAYNGFYFPPLNNSQLNASGVNINALNWAEVGLTYGGVLYSSDNHFVKAAFTAKYLGGIASVNLGSNDLSLQINTDSTLNFRTSSFAYNHNKNADFDIVLDKNFKPDANAFGFDAGLVYEYRGNLDNFKYIRNDDERSYYADRRDVNKYIFKLGVSLLDAGMFTFDKPANVNSFAANTSDWDLKNANYKTLKEFDTALAARVTANANDPRSYNVYLPTALSVQADIRFVKGLFLNLMTYHPVKLGNSVGKRFDKFGFFSVTPRYERRHFGIYIPYTIANRNDFSDYKKHSLGLTLRAGPIFIGSSNLGSMLFNENLRSADVHLGLKVGITYGKPSKSKRFIEKVLSKNKANEEEQPAMNINKEDGSQPAMVKEEKVKVTDGSERSRLMMNYQNGNIYDNPDRKSNVIIINNYYGNDAKTAHSDRMSQRMMDSIYMQNMIHQRSFMQDEKYTDSIVRQDRMQQQELIQMQTRQQAMMDSAFFLEKRDSITRVTKDSLQLKRKQLDTLIRSMQQLQQQIDSTNDAGAILQQRRLEDNDAYMDSVVATSAYSDTAMLQRKKKENPVTDTIVITNAEPVTNRRVTPTNRAMQDEQERRLRYEISRQQPQQDDLYRKYSGQAAALSNDINRLSDRLNNPDRYYRDQTTYVPVAVPKTYERERLVHVPASANNAALKQRDTMYVRDTVFLTVVSNSATDTLTRIAMKSNAATPEKTTEAPVFDFSTLPAEIILFDVSKWLVQPIYMGRLRYVAGLLQKDSSLSVAVTGHTDPTGPKEVNEKLSLRRAKAVADILKNNGVKGKQIKITAYASADPAVAGNTKADNRQNRRVEVKIL